MTMAFHLRVVHIYSTLNRKLLSNHSQENKYEIVELINSCGLGGLLGAENVIQSVAFVRQITCYQCFHCSSVDHAPATVELRRVGRCELAMKLFSRHPSIAHGPASSWVAGTELKISSVQWQK